MRLHVLAAALVVGCSGPKEPTPVAFSPPATTISGRPETATSSTPSANPVPVREEDPFTKLRADLTACYEEGRKAIPTMTSGKVTLHAAVDASGKTACAVPS